MTKTRFTTALISLLVLLGSSSALAQTRPGAVRAGVGLRAFAVTHDVDADATAVTAGLTTLSPGFDVGWQLNDWFMLATRLSLWVTDTDASDPVFLVSAIPRAEFLIEASRTVVPFVAPQLGFTLAASDGSTVAQIVAGAQGGLHVFATNTFSVSPGFEVNYVHDFDAERDLIQVAVTLLFAGWIT